MLDLIFPFSKMCLDAKSASLFILPAMDNVIKGETPAAFIDKARTRIIRTALADLDDNFLTQPTVGVLSQKIANV